jgi:hypothetical protein
MNHELGWYSEREQKINPTVKPFMISLASFVDFDRAIRTQPVLVDVQNKVFLQYNRAKWFNQDTEEKWDSVTVTELFSNGDSNNLGGVYPGSQLAIPNFSNGRDLVIDVCSTHMGGTDEADFALVSVALGQSYCVKPLMASFQCHMRGDHCGENNDCCGVLICKNRRIKGRVCG